MNKHFLLIITILMVFAVLAEANAWNELKSPYPIFSIAPQPPASNSEDVSCPKTPQSIHHMQYTSVYTDRNHGVSIVDKKAKQKYRKEISALKKYEIQIHKWIEQTFKQRNKDNKPLTCSLKWLSDWAKKDSMLRGKTNFQGEAVRKWTLASFSSFYLQIKNLNGSSPKQKKEIENWLEKIGNQVISDYKKHPESKSRHNNHMYWAAWSVMITGVAINNKHFYKWGLNEYKKGILDIQADGTLPHETFRESKAFLYHIFATAPLIMMAETATRNGTNMYEYNNGALHQLVGLTLQELDNNQAYLRKKTGVKQNLTGAVTPATLAWLEVYNARFKKLAIEKRLKKYRPMVQRRIGGDMSRLFAPITFSE